MIEVGIGFTDPPTVTVTGATATDSPADVEREISGVLARHGLTLEGAVDATEPNGRYAADIVEAAPGRRSLSLGGKQR